jgi:hypothetical protein
MPAEISRRHETRPCRSLSPPPTASFSKAPMHQKSLVKSERSPCRPLVWNTPTPHCRSIERKYRRQIKNHLSRTGNRPAETRGKLSEPCPPLVPPSLESTVPLPTPMETLRVRQTGGHMATPIPRGDLRFCATAGLPSFFSATLCLASPAPMGGWLFGPWLTTPARIASRSDAGGLIRPPSLAKERGMGGCSPPRTGRTEKSRRSVERRR